MTPDIASHNHVGGCLLSSISARKEILFCNIISRDGLEGAPPPEIEGNARLSEGRKLFMREVNQLLNTE
jgi:hypothetical protein